MKTEFADMSITSVRASIGRVKGTLRIWDDVDNTAVDPPLLEEEVFDDRAKIYVEGETPEALAARVKKVLQPQVQAKIDYYQTESDNINNVTSAMAAMVADIDGAVTTKVK